MQSLFLVTPFGTKNTSVCNKQLASQAQVNIPNFGSTQVKMSLGSSNSIIPPGSNLKVNRLPNRLSLTQMNFGQSSSDLKSQVPPTKFTSLKPSTMTSGSKVSSKIGQNMPANGFNPSIVDKLNAYKYGTLPRSSVVMKATTLDSVAEVEKSTQKITVDPMTIEITDLTELTQKPLPYPMNGLEPVFSESVMNFYYVESHEKFLENFQALQIEATDALANGDKQKYGKVSKKMKFYNDIHLNYEFFWESLAPSGHKAGGGLWPYPNTPFQQTININFGSIKKMEQQINEITATIKSSEWVWLVYDKSTKGLEIKKTKTQERLSDLNSNLVPLLNIGILVSADHSDYNKLRSDFNGQIWKVVSWTKICERFDQATA